jgi:eukaryotic-like serine/threonine-protein kinase
MATEHPITPDSRGSAMEDDGDSGEPSSLASRIDGRGHAPGDVLAGKYQIVGLLGEGGMGTVWRARSLLLDVDVAIKVLRRERADSSSAERLLREARATAKLGHAAIVRAFDLGETDAGEPFLVMELLEGPSLAGWLRAQGRMSATQAVQMLLPIAGALAAAHKQGIVHRDIKPENIILVPDGEGAYLPKIVDFGIAKLLDSDRDGGNSGGRAEVLTQAGMILGSLEYMSPEQAEGKEEVGEQTDVWALCVVLYELISGRRPFDGPTATALMFALYTSAPAPTTRYAAGDDELWEIIERGLHKSPRERWPTMRALGQALASWAVLRGITTDATGMSLDHHWLGRSSEPPIVRESDGSISSASTGIAPSRPRIATAAGVPATARSEDVAPRRRARARFMGPVASLFLLVPVLVIAGLYAHRGDTSASASERTASPPDGIPAVTPAQALPPIPTPPAPNASAVETTAPPPSKPRPRRTATSAPQKPASMAMPLPATPNF